MDEIKEFKNECRAYYRMKSRTMQEKVLSEKLFDIQYFRCKEYLLACQCTRHVDNVFAKIADKYGNEEKQMLWEHYVEGKSIVEIAERKGIPYYTLKAKAKRIIEKTLKDGDVL